MLRGIFLISLMSINVVWCMPTQEQLEAFVRSQGDKIDVKYTSFGAPGEITIKNKEAKQVFLEFVKLHKFPRKVKYSVPPSRPTTQEVHDCFLKFSRKPSEEERKSVEGLGVANLRIIDFDSIVLELEASEKEKVLMLKSDGVALNQAIDEFVDTVGIKMDYQAKIYMDSGEGSCPYLLSAESFRNIRLGLKDIMKKMMLRKSSRETLILSLVLLDRLALTVDDLRHFVGDELIHVCFSEYMDYNIYWLYRELNHAIHYKLGILAGGSFAGMLDSKLEQDLFRLPPLNPDDERLISVPLPFLQSILNEDWGRTAAASYSFPKQWLARLVQTALLWDSLEEVWNTIGFGNIYGCIYCNRMADINILETPFIFHERRGKFTDPDYITVPYDFYHGHLRKGRFLQKLEHLVTDNIEALYPNPKSWGAWRGLHGQKGSEVKFYTLIDKKPDEIKKLVVLMTPTEEEGVLPTKEKFVPPTEEEVLPSLKRRAVFAPSEN